MNLPSPVSATRERRPARAWPGWLLASLLGGVGGFTVENEGMVLKSYADPAWGWEVPTACAGDTGAHIKKDMTFSIEECLSMLDTRMRATWARVVTCIDEDAQLRAGEALAILSWTDNVGVGAACSSTLMRMVNAGQDGREWCPQLSRWVFANGKKLSGLVRRREREQAVCLGLRDLAVER